MKTSSSRHKRGCPGFTNGGIGPWCGKPTLIGCSFCEEHEKLRRAHLDDAFFQILESFKPEKKIDDLSK